MVEKEGIIRNVKKRQIPTVSYVGQNKEGDQLLVKILKSITFERTSVEIFIQ